VNLPVVADLQLLLRRLAREERDRGRELAGLEDRLRHFEDVERPAYESWLRLELGPVLTRLEERAAELRAQRMLADRVSELVEDGGWHPREALHLVRHPPPSGDPRSAGDASRDEIEARRRAKRERKRAERKQARRSADAGTGQAEEAAARARVVELYRRLARRLHPDSPTALRALAPTRLGTIWAEVQVAYGARSSERLLALATWLETVAAAGGDALASAPPGPEAAGARLLSLAERHARLRALRRSCGALDRRLGELATEPAWGFASASAAVRRRLKKAAARRLEDERAQVEAALAAVEAFLAGIGPPRPPRSPWRR
jgi:hypothetical protein